MKMIKKLVSNSKFAGLALGMVALIAINLQAIPIGVKGVFNSVNSALGYEVAGAAGTLGQALCSDGTRFNTPCTLPAPPSGTDYYFTFNGCTMTVTGNSFNCRGTYTFASVSPAVPTQPDVNYFISCNIVTGEGWGTSSNVNIQSTTGFDLAQNVDRYNSITATVTPVVWCHLHHN